MVAVPSVAGPSGTSAPISGSRRSTKSARQTGSSTTVRRPRRKAKTAAPVRRGDGIAAGPGLPGDRAGAVARRQVVHDIGNSLGAARLHARALAGTPLAADQRRHVDA